MLIAAKFQSEFFELLNSTDRTKSYIQNCLGQCFQISITRLASVPQSPQIPEKEDKGHRFCISHTSESKKKISQKLKKSWGRKRKSLAQKKIWDGLTPEQKKVRIQNMHRGRDSYNQSRLEG